MLKCSRSCRQPSCPLHTAMLVNFKKEKIIIIWIIMRFILLLMHDSNSKDIRLCKSVLEVWQKFKIPFTQQGLAAPKLRLFWWSVIMASRVLHPWMAGPLIWHEHRRLSTRSNMQSNFRPWQFGPVSLAMQTPKNKGLGILKLDRETLQALASFSTSELFSFLPDDVVFLWP